MTDPKVYYLPSAVKALSWRRFALVLALFFGSGATALIYEVLWMKELGLLFGNTAYAAATTLAAFFSGLAVGSYVWGQRAVRLNNPLRTYGLLELAVAMSVAGYFLLLTAYRWLYPVIFGLFGDSHGVFLFIKFALALLILFPPAFFLGGTLPVMSHYVVRHIDFLGRRVSLLYAVNTVGAALGALLAGFYLPLWLGFRNTYLLAMGLSAGIGLLALQLARGELIRLPIAKILRPVVEKGHSAVLSWPLLRLFSFLSGLVTLSLQVLWTRMFAQVLQNSVYTFAIILVSFLLLLSMGAGLAHWLMRQRFSPQTCLFALLIAGALWVSASPFLFNGWTEGLHAIGWATDWSGYMLDVFGMALAVMAPSLLFLGAVFPFLLKLAESHASSAGHAVGQLAAWNTLGAITGALLAGFVLLDQIGLWAGIRLMGMVYLLASIYLLFREPQLSRRLIAFPLIGILSLVSVFETSRLPLALIDTVTEEESLVEVWQGSAATVAVVRQADELEIRVNNYYTLGGTGSKSLEEMQAWLPLTLHPQARSVYIVGLGTGITAGASLNFPIRKLVVTELLPEVVEASSKYFYPYNNRLFYDPRARVIAEDGRNYLSGTQEKFDVIIADLFVPWKAGTGSLYTLEHFQTVHDHLQENGLFMQWLPTYRLSREEFFIIVRTLQTLFPQVTLWRSDFSPYKPVVGLLAQKQPDPLPEGVPVTASPQAQALPLLAYYAGNLEALRAELQGLPVNREDKPVIEYRSPITQRLVQSGQVNWLAGAELIELMNNVLWLRPPGNDQFLQNLSSELRQLPSAGLSLHRVQVLKQQGKLTVADAEYERYQALMQQALQR